MFSAESLCWILPSLGTIVLGDRGGTECGDGGAVDGVDADDLESDALGALDLRMSMTSASTFFLSRTEQIEW